MEGRDPGKRKAEETLQKGADAKKSRASDAGADIDPADVVAASQSSTADVSGTGGGVGASNDASLAPRSGAAATQGRDLPQGRGLADMNKKALDIAGHLRLGPPVNLPPAAAPPLPPRPPRQKKQLNLPQVTPPPPPPGSPSQLQQQQRQPRFVSSGLVTDVTKWFSPDFLERATAAVSPEARARINALGPLTSFQNPFTTSAARRSTPETLPLLDKVNTVHETSAVQQTVALSSSGLELAPGNLQLGQPLPQPQQLRQPEPCPYCRLRMGTMVRQPTAHGCLCAECLANPMAVCPVCGVRGNMAAP